MADNSFEYKAELDDKQVLEALKRIDNQVDKMAKEAGQDFDKIEKQGTTAFKEVGEAADKAGKKGKLSFDGLKNAVTAAVGAVGALAAAVVLAFQRAEEGLGALRIERSFRALAAGADQSSEDILAAMRRASAGTVSDLQLIAAATQALNFNIAQTPEEFARLTESALKLARIRGIPAAEALDRLIGGLGRREVELLDELGLNLVTINAELEKLAQERLGKSADDLSAVERESLFAEAALNAAAVAAGRLGGSIEDVGSSLDQTRADIANFQTDIDKAFLLATSKTFELAKAMGESFFGEQGIFPLFGEGANVVAETFAAILSSFLAVAGVMAQTAVNAKKVWDREMGLGEFISSLTPGGLAKQIGENMTTVFNKLKRDFPEILAPETVKPPTGITPAGPGAPPVDETTDELEKALERAQERLTQLELDGERDRFDNQVKAQRARLDAARDFANKRLDQATKYLQQIDDAEKDLDRDLSDLDKDQARERLKLEREAAAAQVDIETETARQIEDIRTRFAFDLEEAERNRDAIAFIRLQRQQAKELTAAQTTRDRQTEDAATEASRQREELRISQEGERSDALLNFERKLEDLRLANEREAAAITLAEQRKTEELRLENERRIEDSRLANERRLADFMASLDAEVLALLEAEQKKTKIIREQSAQRRALDRGRQSEIDRQIAEGRTVLSGRQHGGPVYPGQSYLVGEAGPELFNPATAGYIQPNSPAITGLARSQSVSTVNNNQRYIAPNMSLISPAEYAASMRQIVRNEIVAALEQIL